MHRTGAKRARFFGALTFAVAIMTCAGSSATAQDITEARRQEIRYTLDRLLASKDWAGLADALSLGPVEKLMVATQWGLDQVSAGRGGFFLPTFVSRNLWLSGSHLADADPEKDPRVDAAAMALYAVTVIRIDGTECADATSPTARFNQLIEQRAAVFRFLASRPQNVQSFAIRVALAMDRNIRSKRPHQDEMLCNFGMQGMMAAVRSGRAHEVPNTTGHVGKTVDATPPPDWKPTFVEPSIYVPAKEKVGANLKGQLEQVVANFAKAQPGR